jgi:signal transduction histidine kinase
LQAGAARLATHDERANDTLREIERVGRSALTDLDHMLGLLHDQDGNPAPLQPTRSTADIIRLVDEMRTAGADIHLHNQCGSDLEDTMGRPVGAAAYRIVQESLTNAIKHAEATRIDVTLSCTDRDLTIAVVDDGLGAAAPTRPEGGRGIVGMTERASVLGGDLTAHPLEGGGFRVEARIPRTNNPVAPSDRVAT